MGGCDVEIAGRTSSWVVFVLKVTLSKLFFVVVAHVLHLRISSFIVFFKLVSAKLVQFLKACISLLVEGVVLILLTLRKLLKITGNLFVNELIIVLLILFKLGIFGFHVLVSEFEILLLVSFFFDLFESKVVRRRPEAKWGRVDQRLLFILEFFLLLLNQILASRFPVFVLDINLNDPLSIDCVDVGLDFDLQLILSFFLDCDQEIPGQISLSLFECFKVILKILSSIVLIVELVLDS